MKRYIKYLALVICILCSSCSCAKRNRLPEVKPHDFVRYSSNVSVQSSILNRNVNISVLLPASYLESKDKHYPVVYMLHGFGDNYTSWNDKWLRIEEKVKELESKGLEEMIYIFPDGYNSYYSNKYNGHFNYMDMFANELVPYVDKTYRTIADRDHRALVGYSMGGFGAMVLALKHAELFSVSAPLSMSFRTDAQYLSEPNGGWDSQWGSIFGGEGSSGENRLTDYYKSHCPFYQFTSENAAKLSKVNWFFHCGDDEEQLLIAGDSLHVQMRLEGIEHEFRVANGAHTGSYWRNSLNEVLPYISHCFNNPQLSKNWNLVSAEVEVPKIEFIEDGVFASQAFKDGAEATSAMFFVHDNLEAKDITSAISILQRGVSARPYLIFACDISKKSLSEWINLYSQKYTLTNATLKAYAYKKGAEELFKNRDSFQDLFFDEPVLFDSTQNKGVAKQVSVNLNDTDKQKNWYVSQSDMGPGFKECYALYKEFKTKGMNFEYRVRNTSSNESENLIQGIETLKLYINY